MARMRSLPAPLAHGTLARKPIHAQANAARRQSLKLLALLAVGGGADALQRLSSQFVCVPASAKLVEAARLLKPGLPVAVVDGDGQFVGTLNSAHILDCIASVPAPRPAAAEVAQHA